MPPKKFAVIANQPNREKETEILEREQIIDAIKKILAEKKQAKNAFMKILHPVARGNLFGFDPELLQIQDEKLQVNRVDINKTALINNGEVIITSEDLFHVRTNYILNSIKKIATKNGFSLTRQFVYQGSLVDQPEWFKIFYYLIFEPVQHQDIIDEIFPRLSDSTENAEG